MSETCKQNNTFCFIPPDILGADVEQTLLTRFKLMLVNAVKKFKVLIVELYIHVSTTEYTILRNIFCHN